LFGKFWANFARLTPQAVAIEEFLANRVKVSSAEKRRRNEVFRARQRARRPVLETRSTSISRGNDPRRFRHLLMRAAALGSEPKRGYHCRTLCVYVVFLRIRADLLTRIPLFSLTV
jgi:hypothetical protein